MRTTIIIAIVGVLLVPRSGTAQEPVTIGEGAQVYAATCSRCHNARGPAERSDREWAVIMTHMRTRAQLTGRETRAALLFLQSTNLAGAEVAAHRAKAIARKPSERVAVWPDWPVSEAVASGPSVGWEGIVIDFQDDTGSAARGRQLIEQSGCMACHKVGPFTTGTLGPDLNTVLRRRQPAWILQKLENPRLDNAATVMPPLNLSPEDREAILAYLQSIAK